MSEVYNVATIEKNLRGSQSNERGLKPHDHVDSRDFGEMNWRRWGGECGNDSTQLEVRICHLVLNVYGYIPKKNIGFLSHLSVFLDVLKYSAINEV